MTKGSNKKPLVKHSSISSRLPRPVCTAFFANEFEAHLPIRLNIELNLQQQDNRIIRRLHLHPSR